MKKDFSDLEKFRVQHPSFYITKKGDRFGIFVFNDPRCQIRAIVDNGKKTGWEHVSVSVIANNPRGGPPIEVTPTWDIMSNMKDRFWDWSETVLEFHPRKEAYVNIHKHVLHLWKQVGMEYILPPSILV